MKLMLIAAILALATLATGASAHEGFPGIYFGAPGYGYGHPYYRHHDYDRDDYWRHRRYWHRRHYRDWDDE